MQKQSIAIVGLGRVGSVFLEQLLGQSNKGVEIVAIAEKDQTDGTTLAKANGIENLNIDQLVAKGGDIDILFDLTGSAAVRQELREKLMASENRHTVIATESVALLIWALITDGENLPDVHGKTGY
ncbi:MAG: homoserine dehydrogenase [Gallionellales bacterium GWA2_59_43]|nr:MAG: homoserine dehydrogenase [Gallionellales bacterium GWA2_59_43]